MQYKEIFVEQFLKRIVSKDLLFKGNFTIDPYQNCEFACSYCDSSFEKTIYIKINSPERLKDELKKIKTGRIIIGSVHDPYQKIEKKYKLTRKLLEIISENNFTCHILTKSDLVLRDIDILKNISDCLVSISINSLNKKNHNCFEKNLILAKDRFNLIKKINKFGIKCGLAIIPIMPYITDSELDVLFKNAKNSNSAYVLCKHLELKGDQKNIFFEILKNDCPHFLKKYEYLYKDSYKPKDEYLKKINSEIKNYSKKYQISLKI